MKSMAWQATPTPVLDLLPSLLTTKTNRPPSQRREPGCCGGRGRSDRSGTSGWSAARIRLPTACTPAAVRATRGVGASDGRGGLAHCWPCAGTSLRRFAWRGQRHSHHRQRHAAAGAVRASGLWTAARVADVASARSAGLGAISFRIGAGAMGTGCALAVGGSGHHGPACAISLARSND